MISCVCDQMETCTSSGIIFVYWLEHPSSLTAILLKIADLSNESFSKVMLVSKLSESSYSQVSFRVVLVTESSIILSQMNFPSS